MNSEEIIEKLNSLLDQHVEGILGLIDQEPHKGDFFELFRGAYQEGHMDPTSSPRLTGDGIYDLISERYHPLSDKKQKLLAELAGKWDEWHYAFDHCP